ncbi:hypothetical protein ZIOFF_052857 [Zingiber officinale]|uniref:Uncharacterized protein n=1 Tax=Zingiber officinale TaxID=94328 RepID=A0A8J5FHQ8_ZINOF|nr:hypothetical protein ZIOFF_052857 [Zingiber officinale]
MDSIDSDDEDKDRHGIIKPQDPVLESSDRALLEVGTNIVSGGEKPYRKRIWGSGLCWRCFVPATEASVGVLIGGGEVSSSNDVSDALAFVCVACSTIKKESVLRRRSAMAEAWERAVAAALKGQAEPPRALTLDSVLKCPDGRLPPSSLFEGKLAALEHLSVANIRLSSLEGFPHLPSLRRLVLSDNRIASGLAALVEAGLNALCDLDLSNNRIASIEDLAQLAKLRLESLDLYECPVTKIEGYRSKFPDIETNPQDNAADHSSNRAAKLRHENGESKNVSKDDQSEQQKKSIISKRKRVGDGQA